MLCGLLDQRNQDKTHEIVRHASLLDNTFDFLDQEHGRHTDASQRYHYGHQAFGQSEFSSSGFFLSVFVLGLIKFKNLIENRVVAMKIVNQIPGVESVSNWGSKSAGFACQELT